MSYQIGKVEVTFGKEPRPQPEAESTKPLREPFAPWDDFREVTRDEFMAFLESYGKPLEHHCTTIWEPVHHGYYDFEKAPPGPASFDRQVAATQAYCVYDEGYGQGPPHFFVRTTSLNSDSHDG